MCQVQILEEAFVLSGVAHLSEFTLPWVGRASSSRAEWLGGLGGRRRATTSTDWR